jgi:hypothetical protein
LTIRFQAADGRHHHLAAGLNILKGVVVINSLLCKSLPMSPDSVCMSFAWF